MFTDAATHEHFSKSSPALRGKRVSIDHLPKLRIGDLDRAEKERGPSIPRPASAGRIRQEDSASPKKHQRSNSVLKNLGHIIFSKEADSNANPEPSPGTPSRRRGSSPRNDGKIEHGKAKNDEFLQQPAYLRLKNALETVKNPASPHRPDASLASSNSSLSSESRAGSSSSTEQGLKATWNKIVKKWETTSACLQALNAELNLIFHSSDANEKNQKWLTNMSLTISRLIDAGNPILQESCKVESTIALRALKDLKHILGDIDRANKPYKEFFVKSFGSEDSFREWFEFTNAIMDKLQASKDTKELPKKDLIFAQNHFWIDKPKAPNEDRLTLNEITTYTGVRSIKMPDGRPLLRTLTIRNGKEAKNENTVFVGSDFADPTQKVVCDNQTQIKYFTELLTRLYDKGYRGTNANFMPIREQAERTVSYEPFDFDRIFKWCSISSYGKADEYFRALYPLLFDKFLTSFVAKENNCDCDIYIMGPKSCAVSLFKSYKVHRPFKTNTGYNIEGDTVCEIRVKWALFDDPESSPRQIGLLRIDAINFTDEATSDERQAILDAFVKYCKEAQFPNGTIPGDMLMKSDRFQQILKM